MKKHFKYLATAGLIAALFLAAGWGTDILPILMM